MKTSIAQAMATGLPVIATNHGAMSDQVLDGITGYLVPEADYKALGERIAYCIEHPEEWPAMSQRAQEHVRATYDSKLLISKQVDLYESLVAPS